MSPRGVMWVVGRGEGGIAVLTRGGLNRNLGLNMNYSAYKGRIGQEVHTWGSNQYSMWS